MRKRRAQCNQKRKKRRRGQTYLKIRRKTEWDGAKCAATTVNSEKSNTEKRKWKSEMSNAKGK